MKCCSSEGAGPAVMNLIPDQSIFCFAQINDVSSHPVSWPLFTQRRTDLHWSITIIEVTYAVVGDDVFAAWHNNFVAKTNIIFLSYVKLLLKSFEGSESVQYRYRSKLSGEKDSPGINYIFSYWSYA